MLTFKYSPFSVPASIIVSYHEIVVKGNDAKHDSGEKMTDIGVGVLIACPVVRAK